VIFVTLANVKIKQYMAEAVYGVF